MGYCWSDLLPIGRRYGCGEQALLVPHPHCDQLGLALGCSGEGELQRSLAGRGAIDPHEEGDRQDDHILAPYGIGSRHRARPELQHVGTDGLGTPGVRDLNLVTARTELARQRRPGSERSDLT